MRSALVDAVRVDSFSPSKSTWRLPRVIRLHAEASRLFIVQGEWGLNADGFDLTNLLRE